jgi:hypothetical protein
MNRAAHDLLPAVPPSDAVRGRPFGMRTPRPGREAAAHLHRRSGAGQVPHQPCDRVGLGSTRNTNCTGVRPSTTWWTTSRILPRHRQALRHRSSASPSALRSAPPGSDGIVRSTARQGYRVVSRRRSNAGCRWTAPYNDWRAPEVEQRVQQWQSRGAERERLSPGQPKGVILPSRLCRSVPETSHSWLSP